MNEEDEHHRIIADLRKKQQDRAKLPMALGGSPANLREAIQHYINYFSQENGSDTPDFILAEYLTDCLDTFDKALKAREKWYGRPIGGTKAVGPTPHVPSKAKEGG